MLSADTQSATLRIAVRAVMEPLRCGRRWLPQATELTGPLAEPGASFVTLRRDGSLLGCIGSLVAHRALGVDVAHNAAAAAFDDPRLPAVTPDDIDRMHVHVSVLGSLEPIAVATWQSLVAVVGPGDGVLVDDGRHRATFLPAVWQQLERPEAFLDALWAKAGLRPREWPSGLTVSRYAVEDAEGPAVAFLPAA